MSTKIREIRGTITLDDGTTSAFTIDGDGYQQWGADRARLGETVDALSTIVYAFTVSDLTETALASVYDDDARLFAKES